MESIPVAHQGHSLAQAAQHLRATKYFQIVGFVILVFDHILTFSEEVERIWKQKISGAAVLFLINRYFTPLQFIVIIDAFIDPIWTPSACSRFVPFEGASTVAVIAVCELIMVLRVFALYERNMTILAFLLILWISQVITSSIGISTGFAVRLPPGLVGCILVGNSKIFPAVWLAPLITNSVIFGLSLYRARRYILKSGPLPMLQVFLRDGSMYFLVIFMANLTNVLIYFSVAAEDLKAIGASFSQLITSTMVSRLVLNLRSASTLSSQDDHKTSRTFMDRTIGNLGEDVELETIIDQEEFHEETEDLEMLGHHE